MTARADAHASRETEIGLIPFSSVPESQRLWLRRLDRPNAEPLPDTDGATFPFWSPDSRSLGFFASGRRIIFRLLSWNLWQHVFLRGLEVLRC